MYVISTALHQELCMEALDVSQLAGLGRVSQVVVCIAKPSTSSGAGSAEAGFGE
jgi:hypothetical protein